MPQRTSRMLVSDPFRRPSSVNGPIIWSNRFPSTLDVETGAVEGDTPICNVTVENIDGDVWTYYYMVERDIDYEGEKLVAAIKR